MKKHEIILQRITENMHEKNNDTITEVLKSMYGDKDFKDVKVKHDEILVAAMLLINKNIGACFGEYTKEANKRGFKVRSAKSFFKYLLDYLNI